MLDAGRRASSAARAWATITTTANFDLERAAAVAKLPIPEPVEQGRRSIAMVAPDAPALDRDQALLLLEQLEAAPQELRRLRKQASQQGE